MTIPRGLSQIWVTQRGNEEFNIKGGKRFLRRGRAVPVFVLVALDLATGTSIMLPPKIERASIRLKLSGTRRGFSSEHYYNFFIGTPRSTR